MSDLLMLLVLLGFLSPDEVLSAALEQLSQKLMNFGAVTESDHY